ncbi:hypothetical protein [Magnetospirillum molischianum]|uniref:Uncharacterized protein n=1 Tax=Magnetospirillum molischianum DSM 120 TaxID=1150626 RepID=H8FT91_MAGML|nr:hypothetical protein [Magnetospirillum molischianum]CCG41579.1 hypothetical protein PHAMO_280113 [Magnetospirillum molischianum DSM 120]
MSAPARSLALLPLIRDQFPALDCRDGQATADALTSLALALGRAGLTWTDLAELVTEGAFHLVARDRASAPEGRWPELGDLLGLLLGRLNGDLSASERRQLERLSMKWDAGTPLHNRDAGTIHRTFRRIVLAGVTP